MDAFAKSGWGPIARVNFHDLFTIVTDPNCLYKKINLYSIDSSGTESLITPAN